MAYAVLELENKNVEFDAQKIEAPVGFSFSFLFFVFFDTVSRKDLKMTIFLIFLFFFAPHIINDYFIIFHRLIEIISFHNKYVYNLIKIIFINIPAFAFIFLSFKYNKLFLDGRLAHGYKIVGVRKPYRLIKNNNKEYSLKFIKKHLKLHSNDFAKAESRG